MKLYVIHYRWQSAGRWYTGRTVAKGANIRKARAVFFAHHPHVQPIR